MYFRLDENRFFVPVSLIVPGSQIPFVKGGDKDKATLDIIGEVIDEAKRPIGHARETVKLNLDPSLQARQKNIQYTTSFNLPPGKYQLKFVVRENQTGRMGSFEAEITLPDMKKAPLKNEFDRAGVDAPAEQEAHPLVRGGEEYVPNISHVFRQDQHLYLLYEIYAPAREKPRRTAQGNQAGHQSAEQPGTDSGIDEGVRDAAGAGQGDQRGGARRGGHRAGCAAGRLKPGPYLCQLNVIDDAGGSFAFPRFAVLVREPAPAAGQSSGAGFGRNCRCAFAREPIRAVAAAGVAAGAALQVIGRGEDQVRSPRSNSLRVRARAALARRQVECDPWFYFLRKRRLCECAS
jgi:hypothetical protein